MHMAKPLVGSVFERTPSSVPASHPTNISSRTGFPIVEHRSKSAFARRRDDLTKGVNDSTRLHEPPPVALSSKVSDHKPILGKLPEPSLNNDDGWKDHMSEENERTVEGMSDEQREEARREIMERFGAGVGDLLKRVKAARERTSASHSPEAIPVVPRNVPQVSSLALPPSSASTRPSSRQLRFAELNPGDVHVYESAPSSPRRKATLALPPPDPSDDSIASLGAWKGKMKMPEEGLLSNDLEREEITDMDVDPEEGSAEYIRRRYFPQAPANDPNLEWMTNPALSSSTAPNGSPIPSLRFDLTGTPIPATLSATLPTHLGLHHHAQGTQAGYTLDDIFLLSRSSVPSQRATMLGVLGVIAGKLGSAAISELSGQEEDLRKKMLACGVEAMAERGSVGVRAIDLLWQCIPGWDATHVLLIGDIAELKPADGPDSLSLLPLDYILPQIATSISKADIPHESLIQLLDITHRLARHSNDIATQIVGTKTLVSTIVKTFLLASLPPTEGSPLPNPTTLSFLKTLAISSRENASTLLEPTNTLLGFLTFLPPSSPYPPSLGEALISLVLELYAILGGYGMYAHIATTAADPLRNLHNSIVSSHLVSNRVRVAWAGVLEVWTICAIDPHKTTPSHDILWSQVEGWGWGLDVLSLRDLLSTEEMDWEVWASVWRAEAAWLEGAVVNGVRGGEQERVVALDSFRAGFDADGGSEKTVVEGVLRTLKADLEGFQESNVMEFIRTTGAHATVLSSILRLWLACVSSNSPRPLPSPPFYLPFPLISELCAQLVTHRLWSSVEVSPTLQPLCRPLTIFLIFFLRISSYLPDTPGDLWTAQAVSILPKLVRGDEEYALEIMGEVVKVVSLQILASYSGVLSEEGLLVLRPFLSHAIRPSQEVYITPIFISSRSLPRSTTQRLPSASTSTSVLDQGLPLAKDWTLSTSLDHLLRSGSSTVISSLPSSWAGSETVVVRASLILSKTCREVLCRYGLHEFTPTLEETIFGCMKVFMLEHGQQDEQSTTEVFRDTVVNQMMEEVLGPFSASAHASAPPQSREPSRHDLEKVAVSFLGPGTPFYQYYTDFVALYDSTSFSHALFGRLVLPPTSMRYALDYRRHLWNDFGHILKTVRVPIDRLLCNDVGEYLWPIEKDPQMISAYLNVMLKAPLVDAVHLIATHHIACSIWNDLHDGVVAVDRSSMLLKAVVSQANITTIREVVTYVQQSAEFFIPPQCFDLDDRRRASRRRQVREIGGAALLERLQILIRSS